MMISTKSARHVFSGKTLEQCYLIRRELTEYLINFEDRGDDQAFDIDPSPDLVYAMNNLFLSEICQLIEEKRTGGISISGYQPKHAS